MVRVEARGITIDGQAITLGGACVPSGLEQCFNAQDDDCDGLIDEGCGLPDGEIGLYAAWDDNPAAIDWALYLPSGNRVDPKSREAGGFRYVKDCPSGCYDQNHEVLIGTGAMAKGTYRAELRLRGPNDAALPVLVQLGLRFGSEVHSSRGELSLDHDAIVITFTL